MGKIARGSEEEIGALGLDFFSKKYSPALAALKIQTLFATEYVNNEHIINEHDKVLFSYIEPLMQFVTTFEINDPENDKPVLYRKIIMLVGLLCGLGNPHKPREYEELEAGINSVMSIEELSAFVSVPANRKREQMLKLSQIVVGIRIFNWKKEKGCPDIVNLPLLVKSSIEATIIRFERFVEQYETKIDKLTESLKNYYSWDINVENLMAFNNLKEPYDNEDLETAKVTLLLFHQMVAFLRIFLQNLSELSDERSVTLADMHNCLGGIQKSIDLRSIIPVQVIYPQFYELSLYWNRFQNMITLLTYYNRLVKKMDNIVKEILEHSSDAILDTLCKPLVEKEERLNTTVIDPNNIFGCDLLFPDEYECLSVPLEYNEFCPVYCCECEGLLYKADRFSGVLRYKDKYYGFKDSKAASLFGSDPEWYITKVLDFCRRNFLYMDLFSMRLTVMKISLGLILLKLDDDVDLYFDVGTQTDIHPIPQIIDKEYRHSLWNWKKDLGQWATLLHYRTHSTQTYHSIFRYSMSSQVYYLRDIGVQTMPDNYTQVPYISYFQYGTRGEPTFPEPHVIHLTRLVDEPPIDILN